VKNGSAAVLVFVYRKAGSAWGEAYVLGVGSASNAKYGTSVSISDSGTDILVGTPNADIPYVTAYTLA
jgi:hypothetical protein